jgi:hypothetical protein
MYREQGAAMKGTTAIASGLVKLLTAMTLVLLLTDFVPHPDGERGLLSATLDGMQILFAHSIDSHSQTPNR